MNTKKKRGLAAAIAVLPMLAVTACAGGGGGGGDASGEITYWLWDSNQQPAYEQCATDFAAANPGSTVNIQQFGWDDYFQTLTTSLVGGDAPDVITNHASFFPQLASTGQLLPLDDVVESEGIDFDDYQAGIPELWVGEDGERYGLPKDWDTVATIYNAQYLADAGLTPESLQDLSWNPEDGGTWEQTIARLSVDANGVRGDEPGFDASNVAVYGLGLKSKSGIGAFGQTQWSMYALSNDWTYADKNPFGTDFNYDDEKFIESIEWWRSLVEKGYMPSYQAASSGVGIQEAFGAGRYALATDGSWNAKTYFSFEGVEAGIAPLPKGPDGDRAGVLNGLADSVLSTTDQPELSKKWVGYLSSAACQDVVAEAAVVFPALNSSSEKAATAFADAGIDVSTYYDAVAAGETELAPIANHWLDVLAVMEPAMESVLIGQSEPESLADASEQVDQLFAND
ncbi:carbohydrate ABC transporter substrate-binding protein (CUT1 family) [Frigoribacterium sp. PhB160]|uniref:ABC transporter substrate-binding protein n=1 Tax=Frigoribacterium sp. PhB160 TaxID=2485192 RepID=UPI000F48373E|nr:sugar ABC transporter substrate-binding protein [Frigoribacterium sp. PhB160]ROS62630.1 carbohydrate ABC transporter substrate-binding protein (CUT1 family) [Frigoribacterium sp. PhB160]